MIYLCLFTFIMLAILGYALYLRRKNKQKTNAILYRSLGIIAFLTFCASYIIISDNDELGIGGAICYHWAAEIMIILALALTLPSKYFYISILILTGIIGFLPYIDNAWLMIMISSPIGIYLICHLMAKFTENKLQSNFPAFFNGMAILSLCLFLLNIVLIWGIAIYDHRLFGYIEPFWMSY